MLKKQKKKYYNIVVGKLNINTFTMVFVHIGCLHLYIILYTLVKLLENVYIIVVFLFYLNRSNENTKKKYNHKRKMMTYQPNNVKLF